MMSELSRQEGLEPVVVRGGAEARVILERNGPPALLITELSLTRADGFELVGDLRRLATPERSPALVVSAFPAFRATATSLMETLGISGVVSPAQPEPVLREAIRAALTGHTTTASLPPASPGEAAHGERSRLALIAGMGLVDDEPPDEVLQKLVEDTARAFDVPIALVSFILEDRQWFKAHFGLSPEIAAARSTAREISFCRHVVEGDLCQPLVVPDAASHPYFAANPLVMSGVVRSYAGAPLVTPSGQILGTLCIIDTKPLNIGPDEVDALVSLARRVAGELELKSWSHRASAAGESGATLALLEAVCSSVESGILVLDAGRKVLLANKALEEIFGIPTSQILEMTREEFILRNSSRCDDRIEYLRMMRVLPDGPFSAREVFEMVKPVRRRVRWIAKPIRLPGGVGQLEIFDDVTAELDPADSRVGLGHGTTPVT
jgi:GAF domain-containing protein